MDTRRKILSLAEARALKGPLALATGYFDVIGPEDVRELEAVEASAAECGTLLVIVLPLHEAALSDGARAEMAASLRVVDYVVAAEQNEAESLMEGLRPRAIARLEAGQSLRRQQFTEYVRRRQEN